MKLRSGCPHVVPMVLLLSTLALWPTLALAQSIADDRAVLQGIKEHPVRGGCGLTRRVGDAPAQRVEVGQPEILSRPARQS